ncbi:GDSL-type esterase/lipase family protein [Lentilactobacillus kosonis]|uniref:Lipase/acylhydrolase with GDSl-like motif n=1 Tax=Lentilactobacillus kosonis TaxID=2810561 RepID=A0A401FKW9_9LACO|nr:GDSL-type esterase/lipase family protein [Lentilactobacillus kosonis]GAY73029.1 lipase/acylhydrolase with GDSl-like motif [Lentilactobacillus kosonis]
MKKKFNLIIVLLTIIIIGLGGWSGYNHFKKATPKPTPINITAVGDSLTQGVGDPDNRGGYVYMIRQKIKSNYPRTRVTVANFGIAGETTQQIDSRVNGSQRLQKQLKQANTIVMTFGGNDLMQFCANMTANNNGMMNSQLSSFERTYSMRARQLIKDVRQYNPKANIFVYGIYNPVYVYLPQVKFINQAVSDTNRTTKQMVASQANTFFIPISNELSDGQYQTKAQHKQLEKQAAKQPSLSNNLTNTDILGLFGGAGSAKNDLISNIDHFHPNKQGYRIMTNRLYQAMKQQMPELRS